MKVGRSKRLDCLTCEGWIPACAGMTGVWAIAMVTLFGASLAWAQTSSVGVRRARQTLLEPRGASLTGSRISEDSPGNVLLEKHSLSAVKVKVPKQYAVHDLVTIIIREQKDYQSEGELETKKRFDLKSTVGAFLKVDDGLLGASTFPNGRPNIDFKFDNRVKNESDADRQDRFTTRITASVVDVKPNGNLVLEARARIQFDEEVGVVTLIGTARHVDITPDNTVLSTQLADKNIAVSHAGAVRDGSRRGWITQFLDAIRPF